MIGFLSGKIINKDNEKVIINVGGVGYIVFMTALGLECCVEGQNTDISIYTYVREQEISLYGFLRVEEQEVFELLIGVSGIGPKAALKILSVADTHAIKIAIINEDISILTQVSGIGPKIAKKVIAELSGKIVTTANIDTDNTLIQNDAINALRSMGYTVAESRKALEDLPKDITDVSECVKYALKNLGK